jgi:hypothetical protein
MAHTHDGLHRITYLSSALDQMTQVELDAILDVARENNRPREITGLLIYHDAQFLQALEGPGRHVEAVYGRIKTDRRHTGCLALESRAVESRLFGDWSMTYRSDSDLSAKQKKSFLDLKAVRSGLAMATPDKDPQTRILIDSFLSSFRDLDLH